MTRTSAGGDTEIQSADVMHITGEDALGLPAESVCERGGGRRAFDRCCCVQVLVPGAQACLQQTCAGGGCRRQHRMELWEAKMHSNDSKNAPSSAPRALKGSQSQNKGSRTSGPGPQVVYCTGHRQCGAVRTRVRLRMRMRRYGHPRCLSVAQGGRRDRAAV